MASMFPLLVSLALISLFLCILFSLAWLTLGRARFTLFWAAAFGTGFCQWVGNLLKAQFPSHESYWITVTTLGLVTVYLGLLGHLDRSFGLGRPRAATVARLTGVVLATVACAVAAAVFLVKHRGIAVGLHPLVSGALLAYCARLILMARPRPIVGEWAAAAITFAFGVNQMLAGAIALLQGMEADPNAMLLYSQINALFMPAAYAGMGLFMVFVLATDQAEAMRQLAQRDPLTGLLNRRGFEEGAERALALAHRQQSPLSVLLCDIDHFKAVNDRYGHSAGDELLKAFAQRLSRDRRREDLVARCGGEEFVLLLPGVSEQDAMLLAQRLLEQIRAQPYSADAGLAKDIAMTASIGHAVLGPKDSLRALIDRADAALYRAKNEGRDRLCAAQPVAALQWASA